MKDYLKDIDESILDDKGIEKIQSFVENDLPPRIVVIYIDESIKTIDGEESILNFIEELKQK
jgi:hypothetical protein